MIYTTGLMKKNINKYFVIKYVDSRMHIKNNVYTENEPGDLL
jgi:hypothetical protein